jgi:uncharacterized protein YbjQ (UPF0145 family)
MNQTEWTCKKCTGINQLASSICWNCETTFELSEALGAGDLEKRQLDELQARKVAEKQKEITSIPVVSIDPLASIPIGDYKIKGIVSAQVIKSTGFLFGIAGMSGPLGSIGLDISNTKSTTAGEAEVMDLLRARAYALGANAVIGVDLDFSDTGGFKSLLICAQGTAVHIESIERYFDIAA